MTTCADYRLGRGGILLPASGPLCSESGQRSDDDPLTNTRASIPKRKKADQ